MYKRQGVYLVSPETAAVSCLTGYITDPTSGPAAAPVAMPEAFPINDNMVDPVSYTHLDVYKRQPIWSAWGCVITSRSSFATPAACKYAISPSAASRLSLIHI